MKRFTIIALFMGSAILAEAQLLEDTDRRLKDSKVERRGFLFFRNKKKAGRSESIPKGDQRTSIRYSKAASPFKLSGGTSPRYSPAPEKARRYSMEVRNSSGNPFRGNEHRVTPRYSSGQPFNRDKYIISPRLSAPNPFRGNEYNVHPRYSPGNPFRGNTYKTAPRYSAGNPFRGSRYNVSPRYSSGMPFRGKDYQISPRYSPGNPFRDKRFNVSPRYSKGMPFRGKDYHVNPRYSEGIPFRPKDYNIAPRYTGTKLGIGKMIGNKELVIANYYWESSLWEGDMKIKRRTYGEQHPSSNYHFAMKFNSPEIRRMLRKWNVFWTRLNGNKQNSKGVNEKLDKPEFDKKERVIWNN